MVTVAEWFRRKFVELVNMGSNPICHTKLWGDAVVADEAHNLLVAGSNPAPATRHRLLV